MNTFTKILLASAGIMGAIMMMMEVDGQDVNPDYCNSTVQNYTKLVPDSCYKSGPGIHRSHSICFRSNSSRKVIYRYDYFHCFRFNNGYLLVPKNCSQAQAPANLNRTIVFNRFNDATKRCDLTPPNFDDLVAASYAG
ncbi:unnamed protein product [Allacma fusca]|uniref:Secreted protein n=1 Tax=Allacma fusca TaxID=39272 RepID=A0A8J2M8V8_9HEXA|nr:unnamed protein product [Allacma fusca]